MAKRRTNRPLWVMSLLLASVMLAGLGPLFLRLRPYWIAKYRGKGADLHAAALPFAPLAGAALDGAHLRRANLRGANLSRASLGADTSAPPMPFTSGVPRERGGTDLTGADLTGAN